MKQKKKRASPWFVFSALCLVGLAALLTPYLMMTTAATLVVPSQRSLPTDARQSPVADTPDGYERFPVVDWEYWQEINPAIVAWITVPDIDIDYAVVQAPKDNPTYYLTHDIYGNWNPFGCPYIDADCNGTAGWNTVIFGHNMAIAPSMFADFSRFSEVTFAKSHQEIYFQTPQTRRVLQVSSVAIVSGYEQSKRTEFTDDADLAAWYQERYSAAAVQLRNDRTKNRLVTFVTCSYNYFSNERTLVFAQ